MPDHEKHMKTMPKAMPPKGMPMTKSEKRKAKAAKKK